MDNVNDVVFDDEFDDIEQITEPTPPEEKKEEEEKEERVQESEDLTLDILKLKGINDPNKIKFEEFPGKVVEKSWDDLTREEQINILIGEDNTDLEDQEIELINTIRESGLSVEEYLNQLNQQHESTPHYDVDNLSDDELYALNLLETVGEDNITDEEINEAIDNAKKNESLYKKTIEGLRKEYINLQQEEEARKANELASQQQEAYQAFVNNITSEINNLNQFAGQDLELSKEETEELQSFILDLDDNGLSAFGKAMNDPKLFTKAAFWILNEDKIMKEINKQIQDSYRLGLEAAKVKTNIKEPEKPQVVINQSSNKKKEIDDFYVDDDEW